MARPPYLSLIPATNIGPLHIGQVFRQDLYEEHVLMKVINVFYCEDSDETVIQARPPTQTYDLNDDIYSLTPEHIVACPIVEEIYGTINWDNPVKAHRIFQNAVLDGESLEFARRSAEHQVPQWM